MNVQAVKTQLTNKKLREFTAKSRFYSLFEELLRKQCAPDPAFDGFSVINRILTNKKLADFNKKLAEFGKKLAEFTLKMTLITITTGE